MYCKCTAGDQSRDTKFSKTQTVCLVGKFHINKVSHIQRSEPSIETFKSPKEQMFGFLFVFKNRGTNKPKRRGSKKVS